MIRLLCSRMFSSDTHIKLVILFSVHLLCLRYLTFQIFYLSIKYISKHWLNKHFFLPFSSKLEGERYRYYLCWSIDLLMSLHMTWILKKKLRYFFTCNIWRALSISFWPSRSIWYSFSASFELFLKRSWDIGLPISLPVLTISPEELY